MPDSNLGGAAWRRGSRYGGMNDCTACTYHLLYILYDAVRERQARKSEDGLHHVCTVHRTVPAIATGLHRPPSSMRLDTPASFDAASRCAGVHTAKTLELRCMTVRSQCRTACHYGGYSSRSWMPVPYVPMYRRTLRCCRFSRSSRTW